MKIAILILAHNNIAQLTRLVYHLAADFDVFIHIDKKSDIFLEPFERVKIFKKFPIYWGSYNTIRGTLFLLKEALCNHYDRYIIISGQDLPIKSNQYIIDFFSKNESTEFFEFQKLPIPYWKTGGFERIEKYWLNSFRSMSGLRKNIYIVLEKFTLGFQNFIGIKRTTDYTLYGGANWMDLTKECILKIFEYLDKDKQFLRRFRYTRCAEEIFFQTVIMNTELSTTLSNQIPRYIDWTERKASPKILKVEDLDSIMKSTALFARKFDDTVDNVIIDQIFEKIGPSKS